MSLIQSRNSLITAVEDWLLRPDLSDRIETFIQNAEARLRRDSRVRRLIDIPLNVSSAELAVPSDLVQVDEIIHGDTWGRAPLRNGNLNDVRRARTMRRSGGVPMVFTVINDRFIFGPEPDQTYAITLSYWQAFESLTPTNLSNWLLAEHPDIYLYSTLMESAPYLRDDPRLETWNSFRESALEELHKLNEDKQYGGPLNRHPTTTIG